MIARPMKLKEFKIGLKLWSTDSGIIPEAINFYRQGVFDYVELYVVPRTYNPEIYKWLDFPGNIIIHCPHAGNGFNLADLNSRGNNLRIFQEVIKFADTLKSDRIIVHPGNNGSLLEAISQIKGLNDSRIYVENKPIEGLSGEVCLGSTPEDIKRILDEAGIKGFVLDFGHAIYAANTLRVDSYSFIEEFLSLKPRMFHLSDGLMVSVKDCHLNFGEGNFNLYKLISYIPRNGLVTLETPNCERLRIFQDDVRCLSGIYDGSLGRDGINIRPVAQGDCRDLWIWRNHGNTRRFSYNHELINYDKHKEWFLKKIKSNKTAIYIAEQENKEKIGQVRFEIDGDSCCSVHVCLNPVFLGKKLGAGVIRKATICFLKERSFIRGIKAEILTNNIASKKAFEKAGYHFEKSISDKIDVFNFIC